MGVPQSPDQHHQVIDVRPPATAAAALAKMATTWLIEEEGAVDDDDGLLKAPRKNRLLTVSRQLQFILCKSNKYKEFEYLVSRPIAEDGGPTAVSPQRRTTRNPPRWPRGRASASSTS